MVDLVTVDKHSFIYFGIGIIFLILIELITILFMDIIFMILAAGFFIYSGMKFVVDNYEVKEK